MDKDNKILELKEKQSEHMKYAKAMVNVPLEQIVKTTKSTLLQKYSKETIKSYLESPSKYENKMREVVDYLCTISPQFCRIIEYVPNMAIITPFVKQKLTMYGNKNAKKKENDFLNMCEYLDSLNVKNVSMEILKNVFKYGVYYGIEIEGAYSTFVKRLDPNLCKIIGVGEAGLSIAFDFSYFDNNEFVLENGYPKVFTSLYRDYKNSKQTLEGLKLQPRWQPLPDDITFVVKHDITNLEYSIPPYLNIYSKLYLLEEYEALNLAKTTAENYTLIGLKIPRSNDGKVDSYLISNDMLDATTFMLDDSLPEYMGYFTTPTDIEVVKASSANDKSVDTVDRATKTMWNSAGVSEALFGVENTNSGTLSYSVKADEQQLFPIYRQIERHYDYKLKDKFKNNFKFKLLDTTWFNISDMMDSYLSASQFSVPVAIIIPLLLGFDMSDINDLVLYQEEIFDIYNKWKALQSSYTTSSTDEGGRPKGDDSDLSESATISRENDSNNKK